MKSLPEIVCLPAVGAALFLSFLSPATSVAAGRTAPARLTRALTYDFRSIRPGSQPTTAQIEDLSNDIALLFANVSPLPKGTLDDVAGKLAGAAATGIFAQGDALSLATALTLVLSDTTNVNRAELRVLRSIFTRAGVSQAQVKQITDSLLVLKNSFQNNFDSFDQDVDLQSTDPTVRSYRKASGFFSLRSYQGPVVTDNVETDPNGLTRFLSVQISQVPVGKYHVNAVSRSTGAVTDLGTFRVRYGFGGPVSASVNLSSLVAPDSSGTGQDDEGDVTDDPTTDDPTTDDGSIDLSSTFVQLDPITILPITTHYRFGSTNFSDGLSYRPLPAGMSIPDISGVTITDSEGVTRLESSLTNDDAIRTSRVANLRLVAGAMAPTAGGKISLTAFRSTGSETQSFLLSAAGLPAGTALTLSVDGTAATQVTTGPSGKLFVKTTEAVFPRPPKKTEVVNVLPSTVSLLPAKSFVVSDAQGNVLLSGTLGD